jgi:hypothetical protein
LLARAGERFAHDDAHDWTRADLVDKPAGMRRAHAHARSQLRVNGGRAVVLIRKPGKEAALRICEVRAHGTSTVAKQVFEFAQHMATGASR